MPAWRRYLTFWRTPISQDVDDELRFHTNMRVNELIARGMPEDEAHRAVAERLGDMNAVQSACVELSEVRERNKRNAALLDAFRNDLRYAIRGLRARPGFAAAIIVTLGLGIGANAAVFSVVDRLLFRTAPMLRDASRTHRIYVSYPTPDGVGRMQSTIPYVRYKEISETRGSFVRTAAYDAGHSVVGAPGEGRDMQVAGVTARFFDFFNAPPRLGRYFDQREDMPPAGDPVVVLSYAMWQTEYGGRDDVLGARSRSVSDVHRDRCRSAMVRRAVARRAAGRVHPILGVRAASMNSAVRGDTWWTSKNLNIPASLMTRKPGVSVEMATTDLAHQMRERWNDAEQSRAIRPGSRRPSSARRRRTRTAPQ